MSDENFRKLMEADPAPMIWCTICHADLTGKKWFSTPSHKRNNIHYCEQCKPPIYTQELIDAGLALVGKDEEE